MKSPKVNGIGEVVTEYGARVMKVIKKGLLGRSLFDFYGDIKAQAFRTKELDSVPTTPSDKKGGIIYTKSADGKLYYKSNEISEVELSSQGTNTTYSVSCVDGDNSDEEKIRLTGSDSSTDDVVLEAGTGLSIARDSDKITFTNTVTDTNTQNTTTLSFVDSSNDVILRNTTGGAGSGTDDIKFVAGSNVTLTHTDADNITISSTDTNTVYSEATGSAEGLMSIAHHDKLDGIESSADVTDTTNVTAAGALMDSELTDLAGVKGVTISTLQVKPSEGAFANGDKTKLDGIASGATADQTNVTGSSGSCTGNSATATALTSGDKTIEGNLRIGGSGDTSNNWISIDAQNGDDSSGGGITFYESGTYSVSAPQFGAKIVYNEDDDEFAIGTMHNNVFMRQIFMKRALDFVYLADGVVVEGTTPVIQLFDSSTTVADGDDIGAIKWVNEDDDGVTLEIRGVATENHASGANGGSKLEFYVTPNTTSSTALAATIDQSGNLDITGNILPGITYVKILPSDFMPDDVGRPAMIDDTGSDRWLESHGTAKLFAYVDIPVGFKATHVDVYGSATSAVTVYEADVNSKTVTSKGTGNIGTQINMTDVNSDATNYILIELAQASGEEVYGGKLTIAKI
tara:strand:+ start:110 stop:1996 length:1887 start_codon:yes stop_codon:yes gene_type:complete